MSLSAKAPKQAEKTKIAPPADAEEATAIPIVDKNEQSSNEAANDSPKEQGAEKADDPIVELETQLASTKEEAGANHDRFLRVSAEFENYKKRILRETSESRKYANERLLKELLSVVDNLERALNAAKEGNGDTSGMIDGVELTLSELLKIFEKFSVKPVKAEGEPFDPTYHQAMGQEKTDKFPENTVTQEFQKGYVYHERLLRPAMVMVAKPADEKGD